MDWRSAWLALLLAGCSVGSGAVPMASQAGLMPGEQGQVEEWTSGEAPAEADDLPGVRRFLQRVYAGYHPGADPSLMLDEAQVYAGPLRAAMAANRAVHDGVSGLLGADLLCDCQDVVADLRNLVWVLEPQPDGRVWARTRLPEGQALALLLEGGDGQWRVGDVAGDGQPSLHQALQADTAAGGMRR